MIDDKERNDRVEQLAESFMDRLRKGEQPSVQEYADKYPELAGDIRELFPTLAILEKFGPHSEPASVGSNGLFISELGEYQILREVGRGGMGIVYEAEQKSLGRHVALKVLSLPASGDQTFLRRFHHEARAAAQLHHTNIVPVFGVGEDKGVHYYAMQFIHGQSLDQVLRELRDLSRPGIHFAETTDVASRIKKDPQSAQIAAEMLSASLWHPAAPAGPDGSEYSDHQNGLQNPRGPDSKPETGPVSLESNLSSPSSVALPGQSELSTPGESRHHYFRSVAHVGVQVAEALEYAHGQGILHRDIKPSNLLLDTRGTVWVTDLGLAKSEDQDLTHTGDIVGTLRYMAPERFRGHTDERSDIYSLGMTLYELLVLRSAFPYSDRAQLVRHINHDEPTLPRRINADIPRDLETIVVKAVSKEPAHRYQSADQLARDLRWFLEDKPIRARRVTATERSWRWCRRNPVVAGLGVSVGILSVVAVVALAIAMWLRGERNWAVRNLDRATTAERNAKDATVKERAAGRQATMFRLLAQARADRWSGRAGHRYKSLQSLAAAAELSGTLAVDEDLQLTLRNEAIASLALVDARADLAWKTGDAKGKQIVFDFSSGRYFARGGPKLDQIVVHAIEDHRELFRLPGFGVDLVLQRLSPDARLLAAKYHDERQIQLCVWDLQTRKEVLKLGGGIHQRAIDFSTDSKFLITGHFDGTIQMHDLSTGTRVSQWEFESAPALIRVHPTGKTFSVCSVNSRNVEVRDLVDGSVLQTYSHPSGVYSVAWSPDGTLLATGCANNLIYVWDTQSNLQIAELKGHQASGIALQFSPSGSLLVSHAWDGTTRFWNPWTGGQHMGIAGVARQFSEDGRRLAFASEGVDGHAGIWEVAGGQESRTILRAATAGKHWDVNVNHDDSLIAAAMDRGVQLWDLHTGKQLSFLPIGKTLSALFNANTDGLFTSTESAVMRWPIRKQTAVDGISFDFGPPETLLTGREFGRMALSADGRKLVVNRLDSRTAIVLDLDEPEKQTVLEPHPLLSNLSISRSGDWVATGTWRGVDVKVWDANSGRLVHRLAPGRQGSKGVFCPNGKWLAIGTARNFELFETGSWRHVRTLGGRENQSSSGDIVFNCDGTIAALVGDDNLIRLVDPQTGRELATLEPPDVDIIVGLCFSNDGSQLVVCTADYLQLWDLGQIRRQLSEIGLDWQQPLTAVSTNLNRRPPHVRVDLGRLAVNESAKPDPQDPNVQLQAQTTKIEENPTDANAYYQRGLILDQLEERRRAEQDFRQARQLFSQRIDRNSNDANAYHYRGHVHYRLQDHQSAADDFSEAIARTPDSSHLYFSRAQAYQQFDPAKAIADYQHDLELRLTDPLVLNNLAWIYVTGPTELRDHDRALPLAAKAHKAAPQNHVYATTLGAVYARVERFADAVTVLENAIELRDAGPTPMQLLFLSLSYHGVGDTGRALAAFEQAERLWEKSPDRAQVSIQQFNDLYAELTAMLN